MPKTSKYILLSLALLASLVAGTALAATKDEAAPKPNLLKGVKAPPGFDVTVFAAPPDVGYPTCLAAAPTGELFVGIDENGSIDAKPRRGRVVRCLDKDRDGRADEFKTFAEMDSPRGLWFDHGTLYVMHPPFVTAFIDDNGDGVSDRSEVLVKGLGFDLKFRGADHTVNGMRMGIDGFLYIAVGDYGAVKAEGRDGATLQLHGGGVVRVRPDGSGLEPVSDGQRNIYDVAVSPELDLFTRDNTNDGGGWDVRLSHVIMTGHYGYPSLFKNFPGDILQPLADYGGGSPCGSLFLDEPGFPEGLGTALYTCEWGRSAVYRHPLERSGASFQARQVSFVEIPRPTDLDVDGSGRLYISSWSNGGFTYSGPDVGFVIRVAPKGAGSTAFPDLARAGDGQLVQLLASPSAVCRLHTQREILRRGARRAFNSGLEKLAGSDAPLAARVAAIFTLKQLRGADAHAALVRLVKQPALREFALRAMADHRAEQPAPASGLFVAALADANPRVRLQAATALGRLGKTEAAGALLPLTADADPLVAHVTVNALVTLRAADVCLSAFDSPGSANLVPGATRVLQSLHDERVVAGLIDRLDKAQGDPARRPILNTLCRLYNREADWDGKWWGTRPDTSGPYFKSATWTASEQIAATLRRELSGANAGTLRWLAVELQRNKVDLPELTPLVLKLAGGDAAFRSVAVELFAGRSSVPDEAIALLGTVAASDTETPSVRAKAIRALQRSGANPAALDAAVEALASAGEKPPGELAGAWEDFARDPAHGRRLAYFTKLAETDAPAKQLLGYGVLLHLAGQRMASKEAKAGAARVVDQAWARPGATIALLEAIARVRSDQYAHQIRALLTDPRPEVQKAATRAADRLGLKARGEAGSDQALIESLPYEQVVAAATGEKGEAKAGRELFLKQGCVACHTVSPDEAPKGPFLGGIATRYSRAELCESILNPNAKIAQGFETQWFTTKDGEEIEGFVTREAGEELDLRNIAGITTTLAKRDIKDRGKRETSMMPPDLAGKLAPRELASLLAYLESLKSK